MNKSLSETGVYFLGLFEAPQTYFIIKVCDLEQVLSRCYFVEWDK